MAHFRLPPNAVSEAVRHRTVDEIWYILSGEGQMWRLAPDGQDGTVDLFTGRSVTVPVGTTFQFRNTGTTYLDIIGVTMPLWPGSDEAIDASGPWAPSVLPRHN